MDRTSSGGPGFNVRRPTPARVYDALLGGKDNYAADREAAAELERAVPSIPQAVRDNRRFMERVVHYACLAGVRQFIDLGTGIPTSTDDSPNASEIARGYFGDSVFVGVDNDPMVVRHDLARLEGAHIDRKSVV